MSAYYILKPGSQEPMGPMSVEQISQGVMAGTITMDYCFSTPGATGWKPLAQLPGLNVGVPGASLAPAGQRPDNCLVWSILVTVLCCWPLGIYAIVKSASVDGLWYQGKYSEAQAAANSAKTACIWSAVLTAVVIVLYVIGIVYPAMVK